MAEGTQTYIPKINPSRRQEMRPRTYIPQMYTSLTPATEKSYVLVAAIDFGTTFSGYAFCFTNSPDKICMNKNWGDELGFNSYKTSTSVLTGPGGEFDSFGLEAENNYGHKVESDENYGAFCLFRHFKMMLYKEAITRSSTLQATNGQTRPAMAIFAMALRYLKQHLMNAISRQIGDSPNDEMIKWVITVPAIWRDEAKQFMREAALKAGLISTKHSTQLLIALEPEAASIYCRKLDIEYVDFGHGHRGVTFSPGTQYLVVDAGGGTIDITAHEVKQSGGVKELHVASGGSWGGTKVDENFVNLMKDATGGNFIDRFKKQHPQQWLNLLMLFEKAKKLIQRDGKSEIRLVLTFMIFQAFREFCNQDLDKTVNNNATTNSRLTIRNGNIVITHEASVGLFTPVVTEVLKHVRGLLQLPKLQNISYLMLVGGFGECRILQDELVKIMPDSIKMIVPEGAQLAIIKGAICFGVNTKVIESRFARKTYGVDMEPKFIPEIHKANKRHLREGVAYCMDVFDVFVLKGDSIEGKDTVKKIYFPRIQNQPYMSFDIYCTDETDLQDVEYVDDAKFSRVGGLTVAMPDMEGNKDRRVEVEFYFGGTEIQVKAKDVTSGKTAETTVDMLLD